MTETYSQIEFGMNLLEDEIGVPRFQIPDIETIRAMENYLGANTLARNTLELCGIFLDSEGSQLPTMEVAGNAPLQDEVMLDLIINAQPIFEIASQEALSGTEIRTAMDLFEDNAKKDKLTGAYNRAALIADRPFGFLPGDTILAVDVAGLKEINDFRGGHAAGDKALRSAVKSIQTVFDLHDIGARIYRFGGDEFIVVADSDVHGSTWEQVNDTYNHVSGFSSGLTYLRAGKVEAVLEGHTRPIDDVLRNADDVECDIKMLRKGLSHKRMPKFDVPLIATKEELQQWMDERRIRIHRTSNYSRIRTTATLFGKKFDLREHGKVRQAGR
jgi:diguanylate cyclase (GGDEF)-like protein